MVACKIALARRQVRHRRFSDLDLGRRLELVTGAQRSAIPAPLGLDWLRDLNSQDLARYSNGLVAVVCEQRSSLHIDRLVDLTCPRVMAGELASGYC